MRVLLALMLVGAAALAGCSGTSSSGAEPTVTASESATSTSSTNSTTAAPNATVNATAPVETRLYLYDCTIVEFDIPVQAADYQQYVPAGYIVHVVAGPVAYLFTTLADCESGSTSNQTYFDDASLALFWVGAESTDPSSTNFTTVGSVLTGASPGVREILQGWNHTVLEGTTTYTSSPGAVDVDLDGGAFAGKAPPVPGEDGAQNYTNQMTYFDVSGGDDLDIRVSGTEDSVSYWQCEPGGLPFAAKVPAASCIATKTNIYKGTITVRSTGPHPQ